MTNMLHAVYGATSRSAQSVKAAVGSSFRSSVSGSSLMKAAVSASTGAYNRMRAGVSAGSASDSTAFAVPSMGPLIGRVQMGAKAGLAGVALYSMGSGRESRPKSTYNRGMRQTARSMRSRSDRRYMFSSGGMLGGTTFGGRQARNSRAFNSYRGNTFGAK